MNKIIKPQTTTVMPATDSNFEANPVSATGVGHEAKPRGCEWLAFRSSVTLFDVRLAMSLIIGDAGMRLRLRCVSATETEKRLA